MNLKYLRTVVISCTLFALTITVTQTSFLDFMFSPYNIALLPEGIIDNQANEQTADHELYKREYHEELYYADSTTNVDSLRHEEWLKRKTKKVVSDPSAPIPAPAPMAYANGAINGEWFERGPNNEAGDCRIIDFDKATEDIYLISSAGHLWKGNLDKRKWIVLNDNAKFNTKVLAHAKTATNVDRIIALYGSGEDGKKTRYSDDMGLTWTVSTGFNFYDGYGGAKQLIQLEDEKTLFLSVFTWIQSPWGSGHEIYRSDDYGESFTKVLTLNDNAPGSNDVAMVNYPRSSKIYIYDNKNKTHYVLDHNTTTSATTITGPESLTGASIPNGSIYVTGRESGGATDHYIYSGSSLYKSTNGTQWTSLGSITINGSQEGLMNGSLMANPDNTQIYAGGFQFYKTSNESDWTQQYDQWWEYYKNSEPNNKDNMHVDIMKIQYFQKADDTPFIIILNHAGIHISYDNMETTSNLGLDGLNVVTLYDHATAPDGSIFLGAQDKGTFSTTETINGSVKTFPSINQTTGDGMRELFFNNGESWFGFLQNGSMYARADKDNGSNKSWKVPGSNIPGWINPVEAHPDPAAKKCYVAGGNINGGSGSYLIEMEVSWTGTGSNFQWHPTQFNYDFRANSRNGQSVIKALSASTKDHDRLYVASKDGTFFYSTNKGSSWTKSSYNIPTSLLPWDIAVSSTDQDHLYLAGTGWSNSGVYKSTDGGVSFSPLSSDAPNATYYDIALTPDNAFLFAATSEGPYVYVNADSKWYDLSGPGHPYVDHKSVEFIQTENVVRFGTYGRGIWDFHMGPITVDCNDDMNGSAIEDDCGVCVEGNTGLLACSDLADGNYSIKAEHSQKCLSNADPIHQMSCNSLETDQIWRVTKQGSFFSIGSFLDNKVMEVSDTIDSSTLSTRTTFLDTLSQLFRLEENGGIFIRIVPASSITKSLDVSQVSLEDSAAIHVWDRRENDNQKYTFTLLSDTLVDCTGLLNGEAVIDSCGICTGGTTGVTACTQDCNDVFGGEATVDNCSICVGGTTGLEACTQDCNDEYGGTAQLDDCSICSGGTTGVDPCEKDCNGDFGGEAEIDDCDKCTGGATELTACTEDCNGVSGGTATLDNCDVCSGGDTGLEPCIEDCNGDFGGTAFIDSCSVCAEGNTDNTANLDPNRCTAALIGFNGITNSQTLYFRTGGFTVPITETGDYTLYNIFGISLESGQLDSKANIGQQLNMGLYILNVKTPAGQNVNIRVVLR